MRYRYARIISALNRNNENAMIGADTFSYIENWTRRNYPGFNSRRAENVVTPTETAVFSAPSR